MASGDTRITVPAFTALKHQGQRITMVTAYDFPMAALVDAAGVEGILVGDSLAMVVQGRENTLSVTLREIIYHSEMVARAARRALVVADMPFLSYQLGPRQAVANAGKILKRTRCQAVKLEGGREQKEVIHALVRAGIPVMGHVGLAPQAIHQLGRYSVQRDRQRLLEDAQAVAEAGAFAIILECIPAAIAAEITAAVRVPTIGIGAGPSCDGQILVLQDLLGLSPGRTPRHAVAYADLKSAISEAVGRYREEVRAGTFPRPENVFH